MDIFEDFSQRLNTALKENFDIEELADNLLEKIVVEPPREAAHGDISSNIALILAKPLKKNPREIAQIIAEYFENDKDIKKIDIAGPGFINFWLKEEFLYQTLTSILELKDNYGRANIGKNEKVNIEYVSANPTGPMHVGHTRGAVFGDALAGLLEFVGYDVVREYYVNDAGGQIDILAQSVFLRYKEALGENIEIGAGLYPGEYLIPLGESLAKEFGDKLLKMTQEEWLEIIKERAVSAMLELIKRDLAKLNIKHEVFFSEKTLHGKNGQIAKTISWLREKGLVYQGKLEPPKGKLPDDWEDREQTLFRATKFGDDSDRALIKSDGSYTYFASDIAYHREKYLRGFNNQIVVLGADHSGYVKRLKAALNAVSGGKAELDVKICQLVHLLRNGKPIKMSKRSGDLITLAQIVDEVGADGVRFMMLFRRNDAPLDFDFDLVKEQSRENPVFYVQYAHARACSIFRMANRELPNLDISPDSLARADFSLLSTSQELALIRVLAAWPRLVKSAAKAHEPHKIAFYLHDLAASFHSFWTMGKENKDLRFINHERLSLTLARLVLVYCVRQVLKNGLAILGVYAPTELS